MPKRISKTKTNTPKNVSSANSINKYVNAVGLFVIIACVFTVGFLSGKLWGGGTFDSSSPIYKIIGNRGNNQVTDLDFNLFWDVWSKLETNYVDKNLDEKALYYGAIKGLVSGIDDPVTVFLTPEETQAYLDSNQGLFEGIGAELGYDNGSLIVVTPLEGSPAKAAGIRAGDLILKVNGEDVQNQNIYEVVAKIRGEKGTNVTITVLHQGETETSDIEVTRDAISVSSVTFDGMQGDVAVIDIDRFTEDTLSDWYDRWDAVVTEAKAQNPKALIIDLRGNPGGYFNAAVWAASDFLPEDSVVAKQQDRNGEQVNFTVTRTGNFLDIPIVVLVDGGSASSSEIFAGALKYHNRAHVIGEKTYGKGTAQEIIDFDDGSSLHITTLKWLLPDGSWLNHDNPIVPDETVSYPEEDFKNGVDPQMQKALDYLNSL